MDICPLSPVSPPREAGGQLPAQIIGNMYAVPIPKDDHGILIIGKSDALTLSRLPLAEKRPQGKCKCRPRRKGDEEQRKDPAFPKRRLCKAALKRDHAHPSPRRSMGSARGQRAIGRMGSCSWRLGGHVMTLQSDVVTYCHSKSDGDVMHSPTPHHYRNPFASLPPPGPPYSSATGKDCQGRFDSGLWSDSAQLGSLLMCFPSRARRNGSTAALKRLKLSSHFRLGSLLLEEHP
jgi:hypothetical protein